MYNILKLSSYTHIGCLSVTQMPKSRLYPPPHPTPTNTLFSPTASAGPPPPFPPPSALPAGGGVQTSSSSSVLSSPSSRRRVYTTSQVESGRTYTYTHTHTYGHTLLARIVGSIVTGRTEKRESGRSCCRASGI